MNTTMSSDSDEYEQSDSSIRPKVIKRTKYPRSPASSMTDQIHVQGLTSSLRNTSSNLNAVDGLIGYYRDNNERQSAAIDRLRDNLARSTESLRQERSNRLSVQDASSDRSSQPLRASDLQEARSRRKYKPTSPHNNYTIVKGSKRLKGRHLRKPSVRFHEDLDEIHNIHETVRDLSNNQIRLEDDVDMEIQQRNQAQIDNRRALQDLTDSLGQSQRNMEQEKSSHRVDMRLQAIQEELRQHRIHQETKEKKIKENGPLSAQLKQAIASQSKHEDKEIRERLLKTEASKQQLEMQLETAQRKLDRSEGVKSAMQDQMEEYKSRLRLSDQERSVMQGRLSDMQETLEQEGPAIRRKDGKQRLQETYAKEEKHRQHLEQEIEALRSQLNQSQGMKDHDKYRRELQQSEKQRDQLSQHLESVTKELENKERHVAKLIAQLQDTSDNLKTSQEHHELALTRLKELEKRLADGGRSAERQKARLAELERMLEESRLKKEDLRTKAKDKIRQWKLKCAKQERDGDSLKHRLAQVMDHNQQILKDGESQRTQNGTSSHHMDSLQREINDILEKRAQQDEQLRLKDIGINELKSVRKDLEQELRDTRNFMDKLDNELRAHQVRHNVLADEKLRLEEESTSFKTKNQQAEDHIHKLQAEWHKINLEQSELSAQLGEESRGRRVGEAHIKQLMQDNKISKDETERLTQQIKQEKMAHDMFVEDLQKENEKKKSLGERMIMDRSNRLKHERAEMVAELQTLKLETADSHSELKTLRRHLEESKHDAEQAKTNLSSTERENAKIRRKYERAKAGFLEQAQLAEAENCRASTLERRLEGASSQLKEQDLVNEGILRVITDEVDCLVEACSGHDEAHSAVLSPTRDVKQKPQHWFADIKSKLQWLQAEMSNKNVHQKRLRQELEQSRTDIDEMARYNNLQEKLFQSQIVDQGDLVTELRQNNQDIKTSKRQKDEVVKSLEKQVVRLEHHIESNVKSLRRSFELAPQPDTLLQDSPSKDYQKLKDLQEERDRINDQYNRYKGTVTLLQQQLEEAKQSAVSQPGYSLSAYSYKTGQGASPNLTGPPSKENKSPDIDIHGRKTIKGYTSS